MRQSLEHNTPLKGIKVGLFIPKKIEDNEQQQQKKLL